MKIKTHFVEQGGFLYPVFQQSQDTVLGEPVWTAPTHARCSTYFAVLATWRDVAWYAQEAYLWFNLTTNPGNRRLPISNMYDNGRICLGNTFNQMYNESLDRLFASAYEQLQECPWQRDMIPVHESCMRVFKFDLQWRQQAFAPGWHEACALFSNPNLEDLP